MNPRRPVEIYPADLLAPLAILGLGGNGHSGRIRRDVVANQGTAANYPGELFLEDRDLLGKKDILWISHGDGAAGWEWDVMFRWGSV